MKCEIRYSLSGEIAAAVQLFIDSKRTKRVIFIDRLSTLGIFLIFPQDSKRMKRSRGTETEKCFLLPPGTTAWKVYAGTKANKATSTTNAGVEEVNSEEPTAMEMYKPTTVPGKESVR